MPVSSAGSNHSEELKYLVDSLLRFLPKPASSMSVNTLCFIFLQRLRFYVFVHFAARRYAVMRCLSVLLSIRFVYCIKMSIHIFKLFFTIGYLYHSSFTTPNPAAVFRRGPLTCNWGINCDFRPMSGFGINECCSVECRQQFRPWSNLL